MLKTFFATMVTSLKLTVSSCLCPSHSAISTALVQKLVIYWNYYRVVSRIKLFKFFYWLSLTSLGGNIKHLLPSNVLKA